MQWDTLITSVGGATVVLGAVGFVLKRSFESLLNAKLKESEERTKVLMAETVRRQAALYDQQFGAIRTILALIYRARNTAKEIQQSDGRANRDAMHRLQAYHESISELLFEQRAILPSKVFQIAHESKHQVVTLLEAAQRRTDPRHEKPEYADEIRKMFESLDGSYQRLVSAVQSHIMIEDDEAS